MESNSEAPKNILASVRKKLLKNSPSQLEDERNNFAFLVIKILLFIGALGIIAYSTKAIDPDATAELSFRGILAAGLFTSMAALAIGIFIGFIFGVPRQAQADGINNGTFSSNTNLEQISDWLTKILVGITLTQISQIPDQIHILGKSLRPSLGNDDTAEIIGITYCIFFVTVGFLMGYLWTRIYFRQMLEKAESQAGSISISTFKEYQSLKDEYMDSGVPTKEEFNFSKSNLNDPQKGKWGGNSQANNRILNATITPVAYNPELFKVTIDVKSTDQIAYPLVGKVKFHLHPSFRNSTTEVDVIQDIARLNLLAWGAFTVGAVCDDGLTTLELDLSTIESAPSLFRSR